MTAAQTDLRSAPVSDDRPDDQPDAQPAKPHSPEYARAKAIEMLKRADQAPSEEDRQTFRALAEQWERMAKVAECPHL